MINVVDETPDFLVVYKPVGLQIHDSVGPYNKDSEEDSKKERTRGLISLLREQLDDPRLFPVHRIDKVTSGLVIVGRGASATAELSALFQQRRVRKYYLAILPRKPAKKQGTITGDMLKARNGAWRLCPSTDNPAITQFFSYGLGDGSRLAIVKPYTGKTHQIRAAMKSIAAPIVGDVRYGGPQADRVYLHAWQLELELNNQHYRWRVQPVEGDLFQHAPVRDSISALDSPGELPWPQLPRRWIQ